MNLSDHLKHLEETLLSPAVRKDPAQLSALLAADFREIGSSGRTFSREEILAELAEEPVLPSVTLSDLHCVALSESLALVTYRTTRANPEVTALRSSLWILRDTRWQILFHQGTRVPWPRPSSGSTNCLSPKPQPPLRPPAEPAAPDRHSLR